MSRSPAATGERVAAAAKRRSRVATPFLVSLFAPGITLIGRLTSSLEVAL